MIEDLNKTQLILLTLLVSFVTSIATGIITFSLLEEAPANVTQTINRVVEKTVEKVIPAEGEQGGEKEVTTVVVKEEDLVIDAISKNSEALVRIKDNALIDGVSLFYGIGILVSDDLVVSFVRDSLNTNSTFTGTFSNSTAFSMKVIYTGNGLVFYRIVKDSKLTIPAKPASLANEVPKLGQTVISLEGETKDIVSIGRVSSFGFADASNKEVIRLHTDIRAGTGIVGGALVNLSGEIVGIKAQSDGADAFVSVNILKKALSEATSR